MLLHPSSMYLKYALCNSPRTARNSLEAILRHPPKNTGNNQIHSGNRIHLFLSSPLIEPLPFIVFRNRSLPSASNQLPARSVLKNLVKIIPWKPQNAERALREVIGCATIRKGEAGTTSRGGFIKKCYFLMVSNDRRPEDSYCAL